MTMEEWAALPEDEPGELRDGQLQEEEMPTYVHEFVVSWLVAALSNWVRPRGGYVFGSEVKLAVSPTRGRKPDLSVHLPGAPRPAGLASVGRRPPSIVIEVVTDRPRDARRDRVEKLEDYARFGVRWYWIVDPRLRTLEVHERGEDGRYVHALGAVEGRVMVPGCDGFVIDLDVLWREVTELEEVADED